MIAQVHPTPNGRPVVRRRVLFRVDRGNLGRQAFKEFQQYATPDDGRKFIEMYIVQHLKSNRLDPVARVCIMTIQRLDSMLRGDPDLDPTLEEGSLFDTGVGLITEPVPVAYNPAIPSETFDVIFTDECHRSIQLQCWNPSTPTPSA